jgi:mannose-1-phosphate guanylyltransferase/mannose-1-phosphate guanylyltransferase/mannose-6-phosphate isomerase
MADGGLLYPVILSGGAGSRLWPLSRSLYPKQLLPLASERTMIQETALRTMADGFAPPLVICNESHRFIVAEQMQEIGAQPLRLVLEPVGRNTAPAIVAAALILLQLDPQAVMAVLPSDHVIADHAAFLAALGRGRMAAAAGHLVTFGITPSAPETGYGYIQQGAPLTPGSYRVARFIEKPDRERASAMLAQPGFLWNSGMFLFKAAVLIEEVKRRCPEIYGAVLKAVEQARSDTDFLRLDAASFAAAQSASIDYAVMEHTDLAAVVPAEFGWSDVGSWAALWEISGKDDQGMVRVGDVMTVNCKNSYLRGDGVLVAGVGLSDIIVVATEDAVLVAERRHVQEVRKIVESLREKKRSEGDLHRKVYRPWGYFQSVDAGARFQVKQITVNPGARLSLHMHLHRAEHWVVVEGTALITSVDKTFLLRENESTFIPVGTKHRLENPGKVPLKLIEVRSGSYLSEDDITRYEDNYGRV